MDKESLRKVLVVRKNLVWGFYAVGRKRHGLEDVGNLLPQDLLHLFFRLVAVRVFHQKKDDFICQINGFLVWLPAKVPGRRDQPILQIL